MTQELRAFKEACDACVEQCHAMIQLEHEKRRVLLNEGAKAIEKVLASQQAAVMQLENLEKKRLEAQANAGFDGLRADELLEKITDLSDRAELSAVLVELRSGTSQIKELNEVSMNIAKENLEAYEGLLAQLSTDGAAGTYNPRGELDKEHPTSVFYEKV